MQDLTKLFDAIVAGDATSTRSITVQALESGTDPLLLVNQYMAPAMDEVGRRFERCDYFVPELLLSARAMKSALELIRPLMVAGGIEPVGCVIVGTVKGDLHDIGKNLVAAMLEGGGFDVVDLGVNVSAEKFIEAARERNARIIAMSALLTTTMLSMKTTIEAIRKAGLRDQVTILIGGAPITEKFAQEIGADAYGATAVDAVALARKAIGVAA
jgi:5-methyltetrahydrofolate--homocysteine methyltransferase